MKSKIATLVMAVSLLSSLVGCSKNDKDSAGAITSNWSVNYTVDPRSSMNITMKAEVKDNKVTEEDKVAVFAGNECKGVAGPTKLGDDYYFLILVNFKQPDETQIGKPLEIRYFSANKNWIYKSNDSTLVLEKDKSVGTIDAPYNPELKQ